MSDAISRRAALEAAFDQAESGEDTDLEAIDEPTPEGDDTGAEETEVVIEADGEALDKQIAKGSKAKVLPKVDPVKVEQEAANRLDKGKAKPVVKGAIGAPAEGTLLPAGDAIKAPQSWTPAEREHWGKVPKEAQAAIARREKETTKVLTESARSRRFEGDFVNTVKPFAHLIRARNSTPLAAVKNLMETAAGLTVGNANQKAAIVAEIIANYGVDIKTLDGVLAGAPVQQNAGHAAMDPNIAAQLQPVHQFMSTIEQARAQHVQELQEHAAATIEQFSEKPFFDDLRDSIADVLEISAARGRELTMDQAYEYALTMNPEIKKIVDQRARAAAINKDPARVARARKAASSINGAPRGEGGGTGKPKSRREMLADAFDDQQ